MTRWEYKHCVARNDGQFVKHLIENGEDGWELCAVSEMAHPWDYVYDESGRMTQVIPTPGSCAGSMVFKRLLLEDR